MGVSIIEGIGQGFRPHLVTEHKAPGPSTHSSSVVQSRRCMSDRGDKRKASMGSEEAAQRDGDVPECIPENDGSIDASKVECVLRRAETILAQRTDRILLVLERPLITDNYLG